MSKVTAPLLSFGAAGQIAKTQVYASWKGRPYARRFVVPANPQSDGQKLTRNIFTYLFGLYRYGTADSLAAMSAAATGARITPANMYPRANLKTARANVNNNALVLSPGAGGAPACPAFTTTPHATTIDISVPEPVLPNGWTDTPIVYAAAVNNWSGTTYADVGTSHFMSGDSQDTPAAGAYSLTLPDLVTATDYTIVAWYSVVRPDNSIAYGASVALVETTS